MGLGDQLGGVAGVDAAAVEDRGLGGQDGGGGALDAGLALVGVVGGGGDAALADGPDRLVGEEDRGAALGVGEELRGRLRSGG